MWAGPPDSQIRMKWAVLDGINFEYIKKGF